MVIQDSPTFSTFSGWTVNALTTATLTSNNLTQFTNMNWPAITTLILRNNNISKFSSNSATNLKDLRLDYNGLSNGTELVNQLKAFTKIEHV